MIKTALIVLLGLVSLNTMASDIGGCKIIAISDSSSNNTTPHQFFSADYGDASLDKCLNQYEKVITYLKQCGVTVSGTIHYAELQFTKNGRVLRSIEPLGIQCRY